MLQLKWSEQGRSQPHSPGWARVPLSSFFPQILIKFSYFSSNFTSFLPYFGPPGGRVAHPWKALATPLEVNNHYKKKSSIEWSQYSMVKITQHQVGGTLVCQAGYHLRKRTFKTHPKHVFFRDENKPYKYVFLHALFVICLPYPFQNLSIWPKTHPFIFRYENRPYKYVFLNAFFLILSATSFPKFVNITRNHTLFFRYENRPYKYVFLHAFFLICPPCHFQNWSIWPKTHHFFSNFARFCTPKRCTRVHCLVLKNNPNYIFFRGWHPTSKTSVSPPPGHASRVTKRPYPDSRPMQ